MTNFKITEAYGTPVVVARLIEQALGMAGATGSVGITVKECERDENFKELVTASVTVARITKEEG